MIWWWALGLLVLAALFLWPLLRVEPDEPADVDRRVQNIALYETYRDELTADGRLSPSERDELLAERGRGLLADVGELDASPPIAFEIFGSQRGLFGGAALVLVAGSLGLYALLGQPKADALLATAEILQLPTAEVDGGERLRALTARVRARVDEDPEDAGSLYLLGIGELKLGAYEPAAAAFAQASTLVGEDLNLDLFWLQARFFADGGKLSEQTNAIAQRVLARAPNQPLVLELLSIAALQEQRFDAAVGLLNRALAGSLSVARRQSLSRGFEAARQSLGVQGPAIDVVIELNQTPPTDAVLFVIARPVGGGIPYAVVRRPAIAIPERVRLDDAVSMNPANPLSAGGEVEVVVRLSLSGEARAAAGDWEWRSEVVRLQAQAKQAVEVRARLRVPDTPG